MEKQFLMTEWNECVKDRNERNGELQQSFKGGV